MASHPFSVPIVHLFSFFLHCFQSTGDCPSLDMIKPASLKNRSQYNGFENIKLTNFTKIRPHICFLVSTILFLIYYGFKRNPKDLKRKKTASRGECLTGRFCV